MKYRTEIVREGERVGDIDWTYNFRQHFDCYGSNDKRRDEACEEAKERLRRVESAYKEGREIRATNYGGWPRIGLHKVIDVGMYDGWPYWTPVPSVLTAGPLGDEWHSFCSITTVEGAPSK